MKSGHLVSRFGDWRKPRTFRRQLMVDEFGKEWLYYRLIDKSCGRNNIATCFSKFNPDVDRLTIARVLVGMRDDLRRLVADGPPEDQP